MACFISPGLLVKYLSAFGEKRRRLLIGKLASRTCVSLPCLTSMETNFLNVTPLLFSKTIALDSFGLFLGATTLRGCGNMMLYREDKLSLLAPTWFNSMSS